MRTRNLTFIFLIAFASVSGADPKEMTRAVGGIAFINKMYTQSDLARMLRHYTSELEQVIGYTLRAQNDLLSMLNEMATLDFRRVQLRDVKPDHLDNLSSWVFHFLTFALDNRSQSSMKWKSLLQDVWVAAVYQAQGEQFDVDQLLTEDHIKAFLEAYTSKYPVKFKNQNEKKLFLDHLVETRHKVFADLAVRYAQLREFLSDPRSAIAKIIDPMIDYTMVTRLDDDPYSTVPVTIAALNEFVVPAEGYKRVELSVRRVVDTLGGDCPRVSDLRLKTVAALMRIFETAVEPSDVKIGKAAFLFYFKGLNYGPKYSAEYLTFLVTKYRKEHLRFSLPDVTRGYPDLLRTYTVDMLSTSMQVDPDFIRTSDLKFVFKNYLYFAVPFKHRTFTAIDEMKTLFEANRFLLLEHYELFNALYDTLILSGEYLATWNNLIWRSLPGLFDDFLNSLFSWQKGKVLKLLWEWEPEVPYFAINVKTNYAFYKLVNLVSHMEEFSEREVAFAKFEPRDDFLVHRFTLVPRYRQFVFFLKKNLGLKGFNYHKLAEKKVSADITKTYLKYLVEHDAAKSKVA